MIFVQSKEVFKGSELSLLYVNFKQNLNSMYHGLLLTHSFLRYFVMILLIIVIIISLIGLLNKKPYTKEHDKVGLFLFICTHTQLLVGIVLFFVSPIVQFSGAAMKDPVSRYWLVEHNTAMLVAIALITIARSSSKKMPVDQDKHKRLFIFNLIALVIILVTIAMSGRHF
jgi:uncharacterized membrane protein